MSSTALTPEQEMLRETVTRMMRRFGRDYWLQCAKDHVFPTELWKVMGDAGLLGLGVPEAFGGMGMGLREMVIVSEELARAGVILSAWQHTNFARACVVKYGSAEQQKEIIGPTTNGSTTLSLCITEPDAGTNTLRIRSLARPTADGYRLTGQKIYIGGADHSSHYVLLARTIPYDDVEDKKDGISLFLVDRKSAGIAMDRLDIVFPDVQSRFILHLDDVHLPKSALVGKEGEGLKYLFSSLNTERILVSTQAVGLGFYTLEKGVQYAKDRSVFDTPIGAHQGVQHPLARAKARLEGARLMTYAAAEAYDAGVTSGDMANIAKLLASEAAWDAADAALQCHGGAAYVRDTDMFNLYAQIRLYRSGPVNNEMVLNYIGQNILGLPKSY